MQPHEKCDSIWRETQLVTPNVFLRGIDPVTPTAGGCHPRGPLNALADRQRGYCRVDDYAEELNPRAPMQGRQSTPKSVAVAKQHRETQPQANEEIPGEGEGEEEGSETQPAAEVKPAPAPVPTYKGEIGGEDAGTVE